MTSWRSSSDRSSRATSPSTPLSPSTFPLWLRPKASTAIIPPSRYKILCAALTCIFLGWLMTSALSSSDTDLLRSVDYQDGFDETTLGTYGYDEVSQSSLLDTPLDQASDHKPSLSSESNEHKIPTIKGALGELHKAIGDKIYSLTSGPTKPSSHITNTSHVMDAYTPANFSAHPEGEQVKDGLTDEERLGARTRIGKCTILFNGNSYYERAIRSHEVHDKLHGYRLHVLRQSLLDDVWSKPAYILSLLLRELAKPESERLEWLFWVDADTIILNPYIPIETFLPPAGSEFEHINLLYSNDWNGLNNGVFPIRVNKWSVELLSAIVAYRYYRPDGDLTFRDQSAMNELMKEPKFAKNIIEAPQRWFNAYQGEHNETLAPYQIRRGDLLVHFAGVGDREARMTFWLDRAEAHLDDWEVPYKSTSYIQEVKDFWSDQRKITQDKHNGVSEARKSASDILTSTDQMLEEYSERLSFEQVESIKNAKEELRNALTNEEQNENIDWMNKIKEKLEAVIVPLRTAQTEVHKNLLSKTHEAIFAAEQDLTSAGFYRGSSSAEAAALDESLKHLKELVLVAEDEWDRKAITDAMDNVAKAREHVREFVEKEEAAKKKAEEEEKRKAEEEERKKLQLAEEDHWRAAEHDGDFGSESG